LGTTVEAKEIEILIEDRFIDSFGADPSKFDEEIITITEDTLIGTSTLTAYCSCSSCCGKSTGITASGARVQANHTIAADTRVLPFGTVVYINGEDYTVEDTGSAIKGNRIDIYFDSHSEALNFGRRVKEVYTRKEVEKVLVPVSFIDYILISGDLMSKNIAESFIDNTKDVITWRNKRGEVVATRIKGVSGEYEHRVEENIYNEWKARR
jgi:3D (Asp-Asp-Asp) domain-containing protein